VSRGLRIFLSVVLAAFVFESVAVLYTMGIVGTFEALFANHATRLAMLDLALALSLVCVWIWRDARARGVNPLPYVALAAALGSAGPLLYLVLRPGRAEAREVGLRATQPA
jgi:hypothetical protein